MPALAKIFGPMTAIERAWPLVVLCAGLWITGGCSRQATPVADAPVADSPGTQVGTVTVVFNLPDGEVRREVESVASGTSIAEVMAKIEEPKIELTGSGDTAFVKSIGDLGTTDGKGWTFTVDGNFADRGIGAYELTPPATIQWKHGAFDPSDQ